MWCIVHTQILNLKRKEKVDCYWRLHKRVHLQSTWLLNIEALSCSSSAIGANKPNKNKLKLKLNQATWAWFLQMICEGPNIFWVEGCWFWWKKLGLRPCIHEIKQCVRRVVVDRVHHRYITEWCTEGLEATLMEWYWGGVRWGEVPGTARSSETWRGWVLGYKSKTEPLWLGFGEQRAQGLRNMLVGWY
jgi:hypothetical protein